MRSILLSGAFALAALILAAVPQAEASWLSQALRGNPGNGYQQAPYGSYGRQYDHGHSHDGYQNGYGNRSGSDGYRGSYGPAYGGYSNGYRGSYGQRYGTPSSHYRAPNAYPRGYSQPAPYYYGR